jgi:aspartyl-tRNA synthetase
MERLYSREITPQREGETIRVAGWVHEIRDLGKLKFLILRDREGLIQVVLFKTDIPEEVFQKTEGLSRESVILVEGKVRAEKRAPHGCEIVPEKIEILGPSAAPLPLDPSGKVEANIDTRLDQRVLDLRRREVAAIFKIRAQLLASARQYLRRESFLEIHTPRIISTASEGGTELFPIAYFEKEAFLAQSPQLYKQMMMGSGLDRIYEIATYFRAEEHNTVWHLNEITAIDCEMAFVSGMEDLLRLIESLVSAMIRGVREESPRELEALAIEIPEPRLPFPRLTYREALSLLEEEGLRVTPGEDLTTEAERLLGEVMERKGHDLYFITHYPLRVKPFYTMPDPSDPEASCSFDLEYKGREVISGSQRIHLYDLLVERIRAKGMNPQNFGPYLEAFRYGMPPHGGFGMGIERFLMLLLDLQNIREAVLFPRDRKRLTP